MTGYVKEQQIQGGFGTVSATKQRLTGEPAAAKIIVRTSTTMGDTRAGEPHAGTAARPASTLGTAWNLLRAN
jgi:hypothetical protein